MSFLTPKQYEEVGKLIKPYCKACENQKRNNVRSYFMHLKTPRAHLFRKLGPGKIAKISECGMVIRQ